VIECVRVYVCERDMVRFGEGREGFWDDCLHYMHQSEEKEVQQSSV